MTADCNIYIPNNVRYNDIVDVVSILSGNQPREKEFDNYKGLYVTVDNTDTYGLKNHWSKTEVCFVNSGQSNMFILCVPKNHIDNEYHHATFHVSPVTNYPGYHLLSGGSNEFWQRVGVGLVSFFGGYVDYNDCDNIEKDFEAETPREDNAPTDGIEWKNFQLSKLNLEPA